MKIGIVGSRRYPRLDDVRQFIRALERSTVIVSGGAIGVDTVAVETAIALRMSYEVYHADWSRYGRRAGALRNQQIVNASDYIVAFWDGDSPGTQITINMAKRDGKLLNVFHASSSSLFL